MRAFAGIIAMFLLAFSVMITAAVTPRHEFEGYDSGGGGRDNPPMCYHEVDPEGRIGPALDDAALISMRNGEGRLFIIARCDRPADDGFRSPQ